MVVGESGADDEHDNVGATYGSVSGGYGLDQGLCDDEA
jgi:hypothetical protein